MAAALHTLVSNPNPILSGNGASRALLRSREPAVCHLDLPRTSPLRVCLGSRLVFVDRRIHRIVRFVAQYEESKQSDFEEEKEKSSDIDVEKEKKHLEVEADESQEAWKQTLESFKEEALKIKGMSQEAYEVYSKKALVILQETSKKLMIQSEKARKELSKVAKEMSEEGKEYLTSVTRDSPDEVKDVVETFKSADELKDVSAVRDFYVGIPYGSFLAFGGFLSFMLTGSIPAIRFGVILGAALLALSISSLKLWKSGKPTSLLLKGQAAITTILFIREWRLFLQGRSFSTFTMTLISGAVLVFYIYRVIMDRSSSGPSLEQGSE